MRPVRCTAGLALSFGLALAAIGCGGGEGTPPEAGATARDAEGAPPPGVSAQPPAGAARIEIDRVSEQVLEAKIVASGSVEARRLTEVAAEVPGRVEAVLVAVGDRVEAGAPLFRIDAGPYRMALAEARAGLALSRAERANAREEAERLRLLLDRKAASEQRYEQLRTRAAVAHAQVAQMEARVARAEHDLERAEVRAPYAGSVVERRAHEGALAGTSPILVLQETGALEAILNVPEATPVGVRPGHPVRLFAEGLADPIETRVARVSERVDPGTRTYEVRCEVADPSGTIKAGSYVRAEITAVREAARPVVARAAVVTRDGRTFVLRIEDGVVREVAVRVGIVGDDRVEVLSGLAPGDVVVSGEAARRLPEGTRVRVGEGSATLAVAPAEAAS